MSLTKNLWEAEYDAAAATDMVQSNHEFFKLQSQEFEKRLSHERDSAARHPSEWTEWIRLQSLLFQSVDW